VRGGGGEYNYTFLVRKSAPKESTQKTCKENKMCVARGWEF
jgi:hypothetical protein